MNNFSYIEVGKIGFELDIDKDIKNEFLKRIYLYETSNLMDIVSIKCKRKKNISYTNEEFLKRQEPIISEESYYREIYDLGVFKYNRKNKILEVSYENSQRYNYNSFEVVVDTIFQFIYLIMIDFDMLPLHASVVKKDDYGIIIMGNSGAGKSTLQMTLLQMGFDFFADDVIFLDSKANLFCSGEIISACTKNTIDILSDCFNKKIIYNEYSDGYKNFIRYPNNNYNKMKLKPIMLILPMVGDEDLYCLEKICNMDAIVKLVQLTISSRFSQEIQLKYMKRLKTLVEIVDSYYFKREKIYIKNGYIKTCNELNKLIDKKVVYEKSRNRRD
ncbi:hypothetical protein WHY64_15970 (plasmid) [Clostridium perfringens]|uniref:hypothetical protein n=1 Tax=Clostridium perfringens TaxID=1502 RepID=UPI0030D5F3BE